MKPIFTAITRSLFAALYLVPLLLMGSTPALADPVVVTIKCSDGTSVQARRAGDIFVLSDYEKACADAGKTYTPPTPAPSPFPAGGTRACGDTQISTVGLDVDCNASGGPIYGLINFTINWLIGILGGVAILAIIIAGIQYTTSQGSPDSLKKAKSRITNAVVGLILLSLMFVILRLIGIG